MMLHVLIAMVAEWLQRHQQHAIERLRCAQWQANKSGRRVKNTFGVLMTG